MGLLDRLRCFIPVDVCSDLVLESLVLFARQFVLGYTGRSEAEYLPAFDAVVFSVVLINFNRLGAEGFKIRNVGDISTTFYVHERDFPDSVFLSLNPYRLVRGFGR